VDGDIEVYVLCTRCNVEGLGRVPLPGLPERFEDPTNNLGSSVGTLIGLLRAM
jgi:hypothetical protein